MNSENETRIYIPRYYGLQKYGLPALCKLTSGKDINLEFVGNIRLSIRQHTSACGSIRQHAAAYVRIRQHTSASTAALYSKACKLSGKLSSKLSGKLTFLPDVSLTE